MRHIPFLRALANLPDMGLEWNIASLGYLSMRAFDLWCEVGPSEFMMYEATTAIRSMIETLPKETPYKSIYADISQTLSGAPDWHVRSVVAPLLAYGDLLERESRWTLAVDVFKTVADAFERYECELFKDHHIQGFARRKEAFVLRNAGKLDRAEAKYNQAFVVAKRCNDPDTAHHCQLGLSVIYKLRGNLPKSLEVLDILSKDWKRGKYPVEGVYARILQARGSVYHEMKDYDNAILDFFLAYQRLTDEDNRNATLTDLGACAIRKGYFGIAHTVLNLVLQRSANSHRRQLAILNLLYLAIVQDDKTGFEYFRRLWEPEICGDVVNAYAYLFLAEGAEQFGTEHQAIAAYQKAASFADHANVYRLQFDALKRLKDMQDKQKASTRPAYPSEASTPTSLTEVEAALSAEYVLVFGQA